MPMIWWTCGGDPKPHLSGAPTREDVLIVVGLANDRAKQPFCCEECGCCYIGGCDQYGECDGNDCSARPFLANLWTFPFKHVPQKCLDDGHFGLHFWASEFSTLYYHDDDREERLALRLWRAAGPDGSIKLNTRNQQRVAAALARFMAERPAPAEAACT